MTKLEKVVNQAIAAIDNIKAAIERNGCDVPHGTDVVDYGALIDKLANPQTFILQDEEGNEVAAVLVANETVFTATENDIRKGAVAATSEGVTVGTKVIPSYHTSESAILIKAGGRYKISILKELELYKYTKLQAIICDYNNNMSKSVSAEKVAINDKVYDVQSVVPLATVSANETDKTIDFGITNDTDKPKVLRFFTYKDIE